MDGSDWKAMALRGNKIAAIKAFRASNRVSLAEAKSAVEEWIEEKSPRSPELGTAFRLCGRIESFLRASLDHREPEFGFLIDYRVTSPSDNKVAEGFYAVDILMDEKTPVLLVSVYSEDLRAIAIEEVRESIRSGVASYGWLVSTGDNHVRLYDSPDTGLYLHMGTSVDLAPLGLRRSLSLQDLFDGIDIKSA